MSQVPASLPRAHEAVDWVLLTPEHSAEMLELVNALEEKDRALFRTSLTEVEGMLDRPGVAEVIGGYSKDCGESRLVAFGYVGLARSGLPQAMCHGGVHPDCRKRGIGEALLQWQTTQGKRLLREAFPDQEGSIVHAVDATRSRFHAHLEALGYGWSHSFAELRRESCGELEEAELPRFVEVVPWTEGWDGPARRAFNLASKQSGHVEQLSMEAWLELHGKMDRDLSFLAVDRSTDRAKVVGLIEVGLYPDDWEVLGWKEGYIDTVAVFDPSMRESVRLALLRQVAQALCDANIEKVAVGIDPQGDPDMMSFYSSLGFRPHVWWRHYALPVQPVA